MPAAGSEFAFMSDSQFWWWFFGKKNLADNASRSFTCRSLESFDRLPAMPVNLANLSIISSIVLFQVLKNIVRGACVSGLELV